MCEYAIIILNMLEYACIYLNKQSSEYTRILNVSDAVHSKVTVHITEQLSRKTNSEHYQWSFLQI